MYKIFTRNFMQLPRCIPTILRIMKLTILLVFFALLQANASTFGQSVTLNQKGITLIRMFKEIRKQTGYNFVWSSKEVNKDLTVDANFNNSDLSAVLKQLQTGYDLTYTIDKENKVILIAVAIKPEPQGGKSRTVAETVTITGTVKDEKGQPMPGVTIGEQGKNNGAISGTGGEFQLVVSGPGSVLVFSFIGYERQEIKIGTKTSVEVQLLPSNDQLHDVVISGYTVQNRAEFTGSSSHIAGKDIENRPLASFDQALAGQAAGVKVTSDGGSLNATPVLRIRGANSINLSSYPLIVIDGVTSFTGNVGLFSAVENNPLSNINPDDIESIEVLKDASATAIYGSRAANGVVVITTKKGKPGKAKVKYDGYYGVIDRPRLPKLLDAADYVMIKDEAEANSGLKPTYFLGKNADGSVQQTNWYDYIYQTGQVQNHNLSISGASGPTSYYVSLNYGDETGFLVKNTFVRKSARANLDHLLLKGFHIGTNFTYSNTLNNNLSSVNNSFGRNNLVRESMVLPPNVLAYNPDGSYNLKGNSLGAGPNAASSGYYNPLPILDNDKYSSESNNFIGSVYAEWELFRGFKIKTDYSINSLNIANNDFNNPLQGFGYGSNGSASDEYDTNYRTDFTNTLSYSTTVAGRHHISALAGYEEINTVMDGSSATLSDQIDPYFQTFAGGFTTISDASGTHSENGYRSYFGNLFYDYEKKYLLSASFRRDGFSGLAPDHKFGNFGGGSVGWNLSEEDFYKHSSLAKIVSDIKLRASYGQVGNVNIGDYAASSLYTFTTYGGVPGLALSQTGNPDLRWETSKKTDIGVNIGLWQNKVTLDADYYNNNIDGLILAAPQSPSKGIPGNSINTNIGSMYNRGLEFDIRAHVLDRGAFQWTTGLNFSTLKNRVTALANNTDIWTASLETSNITRVGYSVGSVYVVKTNGVNPANGLRTYVNREGATVQYSPLTGGWTYLDGSSAPAIDAYGDGVVMGPTLPTYFGGFNNTFRYKNFDLYVNIVFSGGNQIYNGTKATLLDNNFFNNQTTILRRWTHPGQVTDIPALYYNDQQAGGAVLPNSFNVESGEYIKLGTASLGYTIPGKLYNRSGISSIRLYASAGNIILQTKYTGSDPEVSANGDSNTAAGRDKNMVPAGKSFTFGINVAF
jgi:TonB-linked SusC/RagA family outer membrane protein